MSIAQLFSPTGTLAGNFAALCVVFCAVSVKSASACEGAQNIQLLKPVNLNAQQLAQFRAMPPLKVMAVSAPPMARYDEDSQTYQGIGIDVFCFITKELGLSFEIPPSRDLTVADKIKQVQEGRADVFIPLSLTDAREQRGLFTIPYYESHYAVIARKGQRVSIRSIKDLAKYQIGVVQGVSLEPTLKDIVPAEQLHSYDVKTSDSLFEAIRDGKIDAAVFNKNIFIEKRYNQELFDLEIIHTLNENPRAYRFYFSQSPQNQAIVQAFDGYLAASDVSSSVIAHEDGERQFLERYVAQRSYQVLLQTAIVVAALLALIFYLAILRYRRLAKLLVSRNNHIKQQKKELQQAYQQLEAVSQTDGLTGLSNRRHFDQMLAYEYARYQRTGSPLSLLLIDIDHFKNVNDHYGHAIGDDYLCAVADILKSNAVRSTDLVVRYGGDEFVCLLPETSPDDAVRVAERIASGVAELNLQNVTANPQQLTLSIGVATVVNTDPDTHGLLAKADAQLYKAKQMGRNLIRSTTITLNDA